MATSTKILLFVAVAFAAAAGYFFGYDHGFEKAVEEANSATATAETYEDLPSQDSIDWARYTNREFGFQIEYRTNPGGYILEEPEINPVDNTNLRKSLVLIRQEDYEELRTSTEPREGPPAITIVVYANEEGVDAESWVRNESSASNYRAEMSALQNIEVAGALAVRYTADGLYQSDNVAVMQGDYIYLLSGAYLDPSAQIRKDFNQLVETIEFL